MTITEESYNWAYALTPRSLTTQLILHHAAASGATAQSIHSFHLSKGWAGIAYHYYVRKSGEIVRGRPENMRGGHTTNWNYNSIGICFEGNFETEKMPQEQINAGAELIADIKRRYPTITVGRHSGFGQTACPGRNFPFEKLVSEQTEPDNGSAEQEDGPDDWAKEATDWARAEGLFTGDDKGNFRWRDAVTRQELAVLLKRYNDSMNM